MIFCFPQFSSSSPVTHQDDVRKQHLAAQLFSGVTGEPRSASRRGQLGSNRLIKNSAKTNPRAKGSSPTDKVDVNLLQDLDSDKSHAREIERAPSSEHALIPTLDFRSSLDNEKPTIEESIDSELLVSAPSSSIDHNCGFGPVSQILSFF